MKKVNTFKWQTFKIKDVFFTISKGKRLQVPTGASIKKTNLKEGNIPRITVSGVNNGIVDYYDVDKKNNNYRIYNNFISVSFLGTVFYHPYSASLGMKVYCLKLRDRELTPNIGHFLVTIILKAIGKISFSDQISSTSIVDLELPLPTKEDGSIDFEYMEDYISSLRKISNNSVESLLLINSMKNKKLDLVKWENFYIYDIFYIDSGNKFDGIKMEETNPEINFINRSGVNNGISSVVNRINKVDPYEEGLMTLALGGSLGACFVQDKPFYTGQNVVVLKAKKDISFYTKLFIAIAITKESRNNYKAFEKELNKHIKTDFVFKLPATDKNTPDYKYMDKYIRNLIKNNKIK